MPYISNYVCEESSNGYGNSFRVRAVDGTARNIRLVCDLKKNLICNPFLDGVLQKWTRKEGKAMKDFTKKVKAFFKSGIRQVLLFVQKNSETIVKSIGKVIIFLAKIIIESFIDSLF